MEFVRRNAARVAQAPPRAFVDLLGERVRAGLDVIAVPTSEATRAQAEQCCIPLHTLDETPELDSPSMAPTRLPPDLSLIKGGGGALCTRRSSRRLLRA